MDIPKITTSTSKEGPVGVSMSHASSTQLSAQKLGTATSEFSIIDDYYGTDDPQQPQTQQRSGSGQRSRRTSAALPLKLEERMNAIANGYTESPRVEFLSERIGDSVEFYVEDGEDKSVISPESRLSTEQEDYGFRGQSKYLLSTDRSTVRQSMPTQLDNLGSDTKLSYSPWLDFLAKSREGKSNENLKAAAEKARKDASSNERLGVANSSGEAGPVSTSSSRNFLNEAANRFDSEENTFIPGEPTNDSNAAEFRNRSSSDIDKRSSQNQKRVVSLIDDINEWRVRLENEVGLGRDNKDLSFTTTNITSTISGTSVATRTTDATSAYNHEDARLSKLSETSNDRLNLQDGLNNSNLSQTSLNNGQRTSRAVTSVTKETAQMLGKVGAVPSPGWNVKVWEYDKSLVGSEYKTLFVHPDSTSYEFLGMILKKWRYLGPEVHAEYVGPRIKLNDSLRDFINNDGWELLQVKKNAVGEETADVIPDGKKMADILGQSSEFQLSFRRRFNADEELITNYPKSKLFKPCFLMKLNSQFKLPSIQPPSDTPLSIPKNQWARRFAILSKNRYLLFFKNDVHARWHENVNHEIDCKHLKFVDTYPAVVLNTEVPFCTTGNSQDISNAAQEEQVLFQFVVQLRTRTKIILLAVDSKEDQERVIAELNEVRKHLNKTLVPDSRQDSSRSFESSLTPLQRVIAKIDVTRRINDIDLPPFDYDPKLTEWLSWPVQANYSLASTIRELATQKAVEIVTQYKLMDPLELVDLISSIGDAGKEKEGAGMVKTVRKLFKNTFQANTASQGPNDNKSSILFGVPLEELSARYDLTGLGLPVLPPIFRLSIQFLMEKGLHTGGIFRIAGSVKRMELLRKAFEKLDAASAAGAPDASTVTTNNQSTVNIFSGGSTPGSSSGTLPTPEQSIDFSPYNVHDVAGILKMFLRDLPDPLLTQKLYKAFILAEKIKNEQSEIQFLRCLIVLLPASHRHLLESLLAFLHAVSDNSDDKPLPPGVTLTDAVIENDVIKGNLMNSSNLAVVMGPNILRENRQDDRKNEKTRASYNESELATQELNDSNAVVYVVQKLIDHYETVFKISDDIISEVRKMTSVIKPTAMPQRRMSRFQ
ncbi:hypothetical protein MP638_001576 [Amoeboaphelidium occidentale]|nr:hypothetical protein MP638_001576 [Amoeboaphelidium occidentale]